MCKCDKSLQKLHWRAWCWVDSQVARWHYESTEGDRQGALWMQWFYCAPATHVSTIGLSITEVYETRCSYNKYNSDSFKLELTRIRLKILNSSPCNNQCIGNMQKSQSQNLLADNDSGYDTLVDPHQKNQAKHKSECQACTLSTILCLYYWFNTTKSIYYIHFMDMWTSIIQSLITLRLLGNIEFA